MNRNTNGHISREQLALEVQKEALRPTPPVNVVARTLHERLEEASKRIHELENQVARLERQKQRNNAEFQREKARQRRELGIKDL